MDYIYSFGTSNYSIFLFGGLLLSFVWDLFQGDKNSRMKNGRRHVSFRDMPELFSLYAGVRIFLLFVLLSVYAGFNPLACLHNGWLELAGGFTCSVLLAYALFGTSAAGRVEDSASDLDMSQDTFDLWRIGELEGTNLSLDAIETREDPGIASGAAELN